VLPHNQNYLKKNSIIRTSVATAEVLLLLLFENPHVTREFFLQILSVWLIVLVLGDQARSSPLAAPFH
jgi:hypothetical protein